MHVKINNTINLCANTISNRISMHQGKHISKHSRNRSCLPICGRHAFMTFIGPCKGKYWVSFLMAVRNYVKSSFNYLVKRQKDKAKKKKKIVVEKKKNN
jgi:hypothetical protein